MVTQRLGKRRDDILRAAAAAIIEHGVSGLRVDAVAADADINKRMIYHYFGDREGLVREVYALQAQCLRTADGLQAGTRTVLQAMLAGVAPPVAPSALPDEPDRLARAMRILLPVLSVTTVSTPAITAAQWRAFAVDIVSLLFPDAASRVLGAAPGSAGFSEVSKRLLSSEKPRYRLASDSRPR